MLEFIRADQIKTGMMLDLEGDKYATMVGMSTPENHEDIIKQFEYEYQEVESVEVETDLCLVINCNGVSFACPPNHKLKAFDITHPIT